MFAPPPPPSYPHLTTSHHHFAYQPRMCWLRYRRRGSIATPAEQVWGSPLSNCVCITITHIACSEHRQWYNGTTYPDYLYLKQLSFMFLLYHTYALTLLWKKRPWRKRHVILEMKFYEIIGHYAKMEPFIIGFRIFKPAMSNRWGALGVLSTGVNYFIFQLRKYLREINPFQIGYLTWSFY